MEQHIFSSRLAISFSCVGHTYSHLFTPIFFTLVPLALEAHLDLSHGETVSLIVVGNALFGHLSPAAKRVAEEHCPCAVGHLECRRPDGSVTGVPE